MKIGAKNAQIQQQRLDLSFDKLYIKIKKGRFIIT